jgi:exosome complex exonuclease RRP6
MFYYARSDTHYLLYVYDELRNELLRRSDRSNPEEDIISHVLERSKEVSLRRHKELIYDVEGGQGPIGWFNPLMRSSSGSLSREQFAIFRAVHKWRDDAARQHDESPNFIMGTATIFDIARQPPPDPKALHSLLAQHASAIAKKAVTELFRIIDKARIEGAHGPSLTEFFHTNTIGVGEVAQRNLSQLREGAEPVLDTKQLVIETSQLWGKVPVRNRRGQTHEAEESVKPVQFALPWATFVQDAVVSKATRNSDHKPSISKAQSPTVPASKRDSHDEAFTLKAGVKRKASNPQSDEDSGEGDLSASRSKPTSAGSEDDQISIHSSSDEETRHAREKAERKAQKKQRKARQRDKMLAKREAEAKDEANASGEEPFDYSQAQSVLNPRRSASRGDADSGANGGKGKVFNPYASLSAQGPRPARRMHGEKPGKSHTFKST